MSANSCSYLTVLIISYIFRKILLYYYLRIILIFLIYDVHQVLVSGSILLYVVLILLNITIY